MIEALVSGESYRDKTDNELENRFSNLYNSGVPTYVTKMGFSGISFDESLDMIYSSLINNFSFSGFFGDYLMGLTKIEYTDEDTGELVENEFGFEIKPGSEGHYLMLRFASDMPKELFGRLNNKLLGLFQDALGDSYVASLSDEVANLDEQFNQWTDNETSLEGRLSKA